MTTDDLEGPDRLPSSSGSDDQEAGEDWSTGEDSEGVEDAFAVSTPAVDRPQYFLPPDDSPIRDRPPPLRRFLPVASNAARAARASVRRIVYSSEEEAEVPKEQSKKNSKWRERPPRHLQIRG